MWLNTLRNPVKIQDTLNAVKNTRYVPKFEINPVGAESTNAVVTVYDGEVVKAICDYKGNGLRKCVVCFGDYFSPGGNFLKGGVDQEEIICRYSNLYPCLNFYRDVYRRRKYNQVCGDDFFYVRDAKFYYRGNTVTTDILIISPPDVSDDLAMTTLKERMRIAYSFPATQGIDQVFLGAFGCGTKGNDPEVVANLWKDLYDLNPNFYKHIVHPISDGDMCTVFENICL